MPQPSTPSTFGRSGPFARIVILEHDRARGGTRGSYFIEVVADCWREAGHEVVFVQGRTRALSADLALLHVDLSVVPNRYRRYAGRFPIVLNERVSDIRKRAISRNLVERSDAYDGPVIVKTDRNYGGLPERRLAPRHVQRLRRWGKRILRRRPGYDRSFQLHEHKQDVPSRVWRSRQWVVERFLPEREGSFFVVRTAYFLGDRMAAFKLVDSQPIVKHAGAEVEVIVVAPEVLSYRAEIGLDYGKIDYVEHAGRPVVLDVAKTVGGAYGRETAELLSDGLHYYLGGARAIDGTP